MASSSPAPREGAAAVPENGQEGHGATAQSLRYMDKEVAKFLLGGGGGGVLVAFFSDKTFAWVPDAEAGADTASNRLRAFGDGFESFAALDDALAEAARRVRAGLSCLCSRVVVVTADGICIGGGNGGMRRTTRSQLQQPHALEENAGVRRGAAATAMDAAFATGALRGEALVEYVSALAAAPTAGADGLDLAVATAQLAAFSRWRLASAAAPAVGRGRAIAAAARKRRRSAEEDDANAAADGRCNKLATAAAAAVDALKKCREMLSKEEKPMSRAAELMSDCELM